MPSPNNPPPPPEVAAAAADPAAVSATVAELVRADDVATGAGLAPEKRKRGRPKGSKTGSTRHRRRATKADLKANLREAEREATRLRLEMEAREAEAVAESHALTLQPAPQLGQNPDLQLKGKRAIGAVADFIFKFIDRRRPSVDWKLTPAEREEGAEITVEMLVQLNELFPEWGAIIMKLLNVATIPMCLFTWWAIVDARMMEEERIYKRDHPEEAAATAGGTDHA
jgi:hypothetical protein